MQHTKAEYLRRAHETEQWAAHSVDRLVRDRFEKTARHWRELADRTPSAGLTIDIELPSDAKL